MREERCYRDRIRNRIKPYAEDRRFPTGWNGEMTFAEIQEAISPNVERLMHYYRYTTADIPDMLAHGLMRLWEGLYEDPHLLEELDHGGAVKYVLYRSGNSRYRKFNREIYAEELSPESGLPDELGIDGYGKGYHEGHAHFTKAVDLRLDIERAVQTVAERHADSLPHLAALYYLTTSVHRDDAAAIAGRGGTKTSWWLTSVVKPIREELRELLGIPKVEKRTWRDKVEEGHADPFEQVLAEYRAAGNERMATTLEHMLSQEKCRVTAEELDLPRTHIHYLRRKAKSELEDAYAGIA